MLSESQTNNIVEPHVKVTTTSTGIKRQVQIAAVSVRQNEEQIELSKQRIAELKRHADHTSAIDQIVLRAKLQFTAAIAELNQALVDLDHATQEELPGVASLKKQHAQIADIASHMERKVCKLETDVGHNTAHRMK